MWYGLVECGIVSVCMWIVGDMCVSSVCGVVFVQ